MFLLGSRSRFSAERFISRPAMALDKDTELEKNIALVTSGEEDTEYRSSERLGKGSLERNRKPSGLP